jgi:hypothetical protein
MTLPHIERSVERMEREYGKSMARGQIFSLPSHENEDTWLEVLPKSMSSARMATVPRDG